MIKERTEKDHWQFVFLSADLAAIEDAMSYGFKNKAALLFEKSRRGTATACSSLSIQVSDYRKGKKRKIGFAPEDRNAS